MSEAMVELFVLGKADPQEVKITPTSPSASEKSQRIEEGSEQNVVQLEAYVVHILSNIAQDLGRDKGITAKQLNAWLSERGLVDIGPGFPLKKLLKELVSAKLEGRLLTAEELAQGVDSGSGGSSRNRPYTIAEKILIGAHPNPSSAARLLVKYLAFAFGTIKLLSEVENKRRARGSVNFGSMYIDISQPLPETTISMIAEEIYPDLEEILRQVDAAIDIRSLEKEIRARLEIQPDRPEMRNVDVEKMGKDTKALMNLIRLQCQALLPNENWEGFFGQVVVLKLCQKIFPNLKWKKQVSALEQEIEANRKAARQWLGNLGGAQRWSGEDGGIYRNHQARGVFKLETGDFSEEENPLRGKIMGDIVYLKFLAHALEQLVGSRRSS